MAAKAYDLLLNASSTVRPPSKQVVNSYVNALSRAPSDKDKLEAINGLVGAARQNIQDQEDEMARKYRNALSGAYHP